MKKDFARQNILLPHKFNIANNPNYSRTGSYISQRISSNIIENNYAAAFRKLGIIEIKVRLSQTLTGKRHELLTYEVLI